MIKHAFHAVQSLKTIIRGMSLLMYLRSTHSFALKAGFFNYTFQSYTLTNIEHSIYYMRGKTYHNQFLVII